MAPSNTTALTAKAKACLAKAAPIPGMPMLEMGLAAMGAESSFRALQRAIDYLTCKARASIAFTADEKEFLREFFESLYWGGQVKRYPEAAKLAEHYINGKGKKLILDAPVYQSSEVVKAASAAIKSFIRDQLKRKTVHMWSTPPIATSFTRRRASRSLPAPGATWTAMVIC